MAWTPLKEATALPSYRFHRLERHQSRLMNH